MLTDPGASFKVGDVHLSTLADFESTSVAGLPGFDTCQAANNSRKWLILLGYNDIFLFNRPVAFIRSKLGP
jgi:hypothetical protein